MKIALSSDINNRENMEDVCRYILLRSDTCRFDDVIIASVADGLGSCEHSFETANKTVESLFREAASLFFRTPFADEKVSDAEKTSYLQSWCPQVTRNIREQVMAWSPYRNIGTTLSFYVIYKNYALFCSCGDSPVYFVRDDQIELVLPLDHEKTDHTQLTQCICSGVDILHPHVETRKLKEGDIILMGSDGAFGKLSLDELLLLCRSGARPLSEAILTAARKTTNDNQAIVVTLYNES